MHNNLRNFLQSSSSSDPPLTPFQEVKIFYLNHTIICPSVLYLKIFLLNLII